ncbi:MULTISPECIES: hypothetical protein [unclassified Streptomyces]|uniref:hypothetical protein n=1 Tax=unclassified Streptomyces TaxID=2593676 RepID=UPI002E14EDE0|nr:hypothetical protein OG573_31375 [Streptomyces sp. NBC_01205]
MTALLRLYPAAYRREFGDEIADAYREAVDGADGAARIREAVDVIGHALRMRLRLGSAGRAGRLLAALAPFAVVALGANAVFWWRLTLPALRWGRPLDETGPVVLTVVAALVTVLGAVLALTTRWTAGAWTVLVATAATFTAQAVRPGTGLEFAVLFSGPPLLLSLVAVACPPDLRPAARLRTAAGVSAALAAVAATAALAVASQVWPLGGPAVAATVVGGLALAGQQSFVRLRTAPEVLLAGLPFVVLGVFAGLWNGLALPAALVLLVAASTAVSIRRRRGGSTTPSR